MFHDIINAYADAIYVATMLRPPVSAAVADECERFADGEERRRAKSSARLAGRIADWLRTRLDRGFGATGAPARPSFIRAPHAGSPLPKI
jgi:hypothetical protein